MKQLVRMNIEQVCGHKCLVLWQHPSRRSKRSSKRRKITCKYVNSNITRFESYNLPKSKKACLAHADGLWVGPTLECAQDDDWESAGILQSIGQVLSA